MCIHIFRGNHRTQKIFRKKITFKTAYRLLEAPGNLQTSILRDLRITRFKKLSYFYFFASILPFELQKWKDLG